MLEKIKKYFRYLFKTKDKYIKETHLRLKTNCVYTIDELETIRKSGNENIYKRALLENDFANMLINDFIKQLKIKYYGRE